MAAAIGCRGSGRTQIPPAPCSGQRSGAQSREPTHSQRCGAPTSVHGTSPPRARKHPSFPMALPSTEPPPLTPPLQASARNPNDTKTPQREPPGAAASPHGAAPWKRKAARFGSCGPARTCAEAQRAARPVSSAPRRRDRRMPEMAVGPTARRTLRSGEERAVDTAEVTGGPQHPAGRGAGSGDGASASHRRHLGGAGPGGGKDPWRRRCPHRAVRGAA